MIVEKKIIEKLQIEHSHSPLALKVFDPKKPNNFWFVSASDFHKTVAPIRYQDVMRLNRYYAFTKKSLKEMLKDPFRNFYNCTTPRGSKLLRIDLNNNFIFEVDSYVPFSTPFYLDAFVGYISSDRFDLNKAVRILKRRKYVTNIHIVRPSYTNTRHITCTVHFPQRKYADLYRTAMAYKHETGSPVHYYMKEFLTYNPRFGYDFLGVKSAYIGDKKHNGKNTH